MNPTKDVSELRDIKIFTGSEDLADRENTQQRWEIYKKHLESTLTDLPDEVREAQLQLAYNRWHGIKSSKDVIALANSHEKNVGEVFQGVYGSEAIDE